MAGLGEQGKRKARNRSVDLSVDPEPGPVWIRPPQDECDPEHQWTCQVGTESIDRERVIVRSVSHALSGSLAEFALVQQTRDRGAWRDVAEVDSCHDVDVHVHRYARSTGQRIGDPEKLCDLTKDGDLDAGYTLAYDKVIDAWDHNKQR